MKNDCDNCTHKGICVVEAPKRVMDKVVTDMNNMQEGNPFTVYGACSRYAAIVATAR